MTFQEIYDNFGKIWDRSGSPYLPEDQFDALANLKYNDYVTSECTLLEINAEHSTRIFPLYKRFTKLNSNVVVFDTDIADFRYPIKFVGTFNIKCGTSSVPQVRAIRKAPNNFSAEMQQDPFNKGTNRDPTYVLDVNAAGNKIFQIQSDTPPTTYTLLYVKTPQVINVAGAPATPFELDDHVAWAIINAVVARGDVLVENLPRANAEMSMEGAKPNV
jgi:hypothetical protein